jgi:hypothetical protein
MGFRKHVGESKLLVLEELENCVDEPLTDDAWNALVGLSNLEIMYLEGWLRSALKKYMLKEED